MRLAAQFVKHVVPSVIKPVRVLWNEVIGFLFLVLATFVGLSSYRRAQNFTGDTGEMILLICYFAFAALLAYYGVSSFWKARKISRS
jgi:hypothetical protein